MAMSDFLKIIWFSIFCSFLLGCYSNKSPADPQIKLLTNKLWLPDSLLTYSISEDSLLLDSSHLANYSSLKIYAFIDVSCPSCIADIDRWNQVVPEFMKYKVPVLLICFSENNFEYIKYLFENGQVKKFPFPLFLDVTKQLHKLNSFVKENEAHQVILTDQCNTILATGNPLFSDDIKALYLKTIAMHDKSE